MPNYLPEREEHHLPESGCGEYQQKPLFWILLSLGDDTDHLPVNEYNDSDT